MDWLSKKINIIHKKILKLISNKFIIQNYSLFKLPLTLQNSTKLSKL